MPARTRQRIAILGVVAAGLAVAAIARVPGKPAPAQQGPLPRACFLRDAPGGAPWPQSHANGCMVRIPGGRYVLGAQAQDPAGRNYDPAAGDDEGVREVELAPFWLDLEEVSLTRFADCVSAGGCRADDVRLGVPLETAAHDHPRAPVTGIPWAAADAYCRFIGGRLPTEAEWEAAARGTASTRFPWGDEPPTCERTIRSEKGVGGCGANGPRPVTWVPHVATNNGLSAMSGNVWEWVADWYGPPDPALPRGPATGTKRVQKGGGWSSDDPAVLRSAARAALEPDIRLDDLGFRCAADAVRPADAAPAPRTEPPPGEVEPAVPATGPSPFRGVWRLTRRDGPDAPDVACPPVEVRVDGSLLQPGRLEGRVEPSGALTIEMRDDDHTRLTGACTNARCEGEFRSGARSGTFTLVRE